VEPLVGAQLVAAVRETGWIRPAAARCGIAESSVREWIQRGKGEHPTRGATREFAAFAADIARALRGDASVQVSPRHAFTPAA